MSPTASMQTAIVTSADGTLSASHSHPVPPCPRDSVLVRVRAVALNPSDNKVPAVVKRAGLVSGCDFAGEIVEVGPGANAQLQDSRRPWGVGDRVCGAVMGANPDQPTRGAFAQFVAADPVVLARLPELWDWESGAGLGGSCIGAVGQALFKELQLVSPGDLGTLVVQARKVAAQRGDQSQIPPSIAKSDLPKVVLVYGGSTASGTIALQLIRLAGYIPITTCSPRNNALVTAYGAVASFDYSSPSCAQEIKSYTSNSLALVLDCIGTAQSATLCYAAIGRPGGQYVSLEKFPDAVAASRRAVRASWVMGPLMLGNAVRLGDGYNIDADPAVRDFGRAWFAVVQQLLAVDGIRSHPVRVLSGAGGKGGWEEEVLAGLGQLRSGTVSGEKLVVDVQ
ncbi:putative alcohol dehydrogenase [Chaetomium sp. MPI-CAGE-AT-0009]|nr:putative alcohol dehydrogenase [Chaetomium sp. MPI-CAGE-AT-0009]